MPRFYSRLLLLPLVLLTAALLLIHAQPYDDHELRQLLLPEGCPAPCFMGIRPGVTTVDEAAAILKSSKWIGKFVVSGGYDLELRDLSWDWSDQKPTWIVDTTRGYADAAGAYITSMTIETHLSLGDVRLAFGVPDWETANVLGDNQYEFYSGFYRQYGIVVQRTFACNLTEPLKGNINIHLVPPTNPIPSATGRLSDIFRVC